MPERVRPSVRRARRAMLATLAPLAAALPLVAGAQAPTAPRPAAPAPTAPTPAAQAPDSTTPLDARLATGTRVRIALSSYRGARVEGTIDSVLPRAFVVDTAEQRQFLIFSPGPPLIDRYRIMRVGFDEIEQVEVSTGSSRWRGALRWGLVAAALGAGINALSNSPERNPTSRDMLGAATEGAIIGGVLGGGFGYLQGRERWRTVAAPGRKP